MGSRGGEGLIHEDDLRVGGKGAGYADALPLASGELGGVLAAVLVRLQVDQLQQLGDPVVDFFLGVPATRMARAMLSSTVIWGNRPPSWTT